jgi:prepilin-type processing-associated H-X9-DG protein
VKNASKTTQCANNLRQLGLGCLSYTEDNDGIVPPNDAFFLGPAAPAQRKFHILLIRGGYHCSDAIPTFMSWWYTPFGSLRIFHCPSLSTSDPVTSSSTSYGYTAAFADPGMAGWGGGFRPIGKVKQASIVPWIADRALINDSKQWLGYDPTQGANPWNYPGTSHSNGANYLFMDGHTARLDQSRATFPGAGTATAFNDVIKWRPDL